MDAPLPSPDAPQHIIKLRRDYNAWVARETLEDYALRYTPHRFRRWSTWRVANTAFGAASFLILEAVGATLLLHYGWTNAALAILATGLIIFLAGLPISVYAARHGVDMDLLTRGAGFGYIGSTLTSLIYASFTFIFFALEAAVMAYALELALDIPPQWGYLLCALVVIPLVTHGISAISRLQLWTQPLWLALLVLPFAWVGWRHPGAFDGITTQVGSQSGTAAFDAHAFGAALTVGVALITQMGEQADYLRFMPRLTARNRVGWWAAVLAGGPGWIVLGVLKMLGGAMLAWLAVSHAVPPERAVDPNQMYLAAYEYVFPRYGWAVAATALFVVVSQLKINVTNAYAGSLAWSNFFSRLTHSHPGRVVWVVFNTLIAFMLMSMNVFEALGHVLGLYANLAIAWIMAVVADLVINKPLGLSPPGIEFKRAHLYDVNPVGVGAMALASVLSVAAHLGVMGPMAQAWSAAIAMVTALVASPLIAWATEGRYYLARPAGEFGGVGEVDPGELGPGEPGTGKFGGASGEAAAVAVHRCVICERDYEGPDMAHCPAYRGAICSLCCTLDARCGDLCKPRANLSAQWTAALRRVLPRRVWPYLDTGLGHYLLLMGVITPLLATLFGLLYHQQLQQLPPLIDAAAQEALRASLRAGLLKAFFALLLVAGTVAWWLVLAHQSREVAQEESKRQTQALMREIASHRRTDEALQGARHQAERAQAAAEAANQAKSRYISTISHELRTPLNSILGYAQLMAADASLPPQRRQAVQVIKRGGEHLMQLIDGTLDIARIEAGRLSLEPAPVRFADLLRELADMFEPQAAAKGLGFRFEPHGTLPEWVRADERRLRQILINLLGNAIKFTAEGEVVLRVRHGREMATVEIADTGPGLDAAELARIFEPFARGASGAGGAPGAGLGLTIAKMLTELMGGEMSASSAPGRGSTFRVRLFVPELHGRVPDDTRHRRPAPERTRLDGVSPRVLVVDNESDDRHLLIELLEPLGFTVREASSGHDALDLVAAGWVPDAVLMDLAMPGIDGWETIRRLRRMLEDLGVRPPVIAIVSANAFERGQENDAGIDARDFILKPVRHELLLDWLTERLSLRWRADAGTVPGAAASAAAIAVEPPAPVEIPPPAQLAGLREALELGYYRGVMQQLDEIEATAPRWRAFCETQRALARQFQFEAMLRGLMRGEARGEVPANDDLPDRPR
ncbi:ATP-binding protein [Mitsuaria sp. GD03876]|uniref:hybrid sensor histidine kinase/response regulator n=1 Tax=Mitsuaria sp. GD03876 TaxID=2975399 RepID=UPI0024476734|nr:ATP-binding protein [Mitsuaria sp. GD03876]MDH0866752.1 ATP-binding protein [Mitsuaria sp. GD03876]